MNELPNEEEVDVRLLEKILDYTYMSASYKVYWFLGIFKEIRQGNQIISFRRIVHRMITNSWYSLTEYHLNFGYNDKLYESVSYIRDTYHLESNIREEKLLKWLENIEDTVLEKKIVKFYDLVPYRLLTPFFSKILVGISDSKKNRIIEERSLDSNKVLYKIHRKGKQIFINNKWFDYILKNQMIIEGWINYKRIYYLQKKNPNVPNILFKLEPVYNRDLHIAKKFWKKVLITTDINDIYTNKSFDKDNLKKYGEISIDHFIPWSFVIHDELWNLIPTFKNINSSKSNKLPKLDVYMDSFCDIQYRAFSKIKSNKGNRKLLEDYLTINNTLDINNLVAANREITKAEFSDSLTKTIVPLFQIAYNQGYQMWENNIV